MNLRIGAGTIAAPSTHGTARPSRALRTSYMHNGAFKSLRDVVEFYASRATDPLHWYKSGVRFEDVPAPYRQYVNQQSIPYNRREGDAPALDSAEIDAIVAFLQTLTDARLPSGEAAPVAVAR